MFGALITLSPIKKVILLLPSIGRMVAVVVVIRMVVVKMKGFFSLEGSVIVVVVEVTSLLAIHLHEWASYTPELSETDRFEAEQLQKNLCPTTFSLK